MKNKKKDYSKIKTKSQCSCLSNIVELIFSCFLALKKNRSLSEELTLFEGDLVLRDSVIDRVTEYGTVLPENTNGTRKHGDVEAEAMTRPYWYRWGGAVVPYQIDRSLSK